MTDEATEKAEFRAAAERLERAVSAVEAIGQSSSELHTVVGRLHDRIDAVISAHSTTREELTKLTERIEGVVLWVEQRTRDHSDDLREHAAEVQRELARQEAAARKHAEAVQRELQRQEAEAQAHAEAIAEQHRIELQRSTRTQLIKWAAGGLAALIATSATLVGLAQSIWQHK